MIFEHILFIITYIVNILTKFLFHPSNPRDDRAVFHEDGTSSLHSFNQHYLYIPHLQEAEETVFRKHRVNYRYLLNGYSLNITKPLD